MPLWRSNRVYAAQSPQQSEQSETTKSDDSSSGEYETDSETETEQTQQPPARKAQNAAKQTPHFAKNDHPDSLGRLCV